MKISRKDSKKGEGSAQSDKELADLLKAALKAKAEKGDPGKDGRDGRHGKDGRAGRDGNPGRDGRDGRGLKGMKQLDDSKVAFIYTDDEQEEITLKAGKDGKDGLNGKDGRDGKDGKPGAPGKVGKAGKDGKGIVSVTQPDPGIAHINYTDGTHDTIHLPPGEDGREVELRATAQAIQWRLQGDRDWKDLLDLSVLRAAANSQQFGAGALRIRITTLSDVKLTNLQDGDTLIWDASAKRWVNMPATGAATWGAIGGDITNQTDLMTAFTNNSAGDRARANHTGTQLANTISDFSTAADARITAQKGQPSGLATLDSNSKIPQIQLPAIAISSTFVVNSQAAQLALVAEEGDVAVRTDQNKSYIQNGGTSGTMTDWTELLTPTDLVLSVNGQVGAVTLDTDDISEGTNKYFTDERVDDRVALLLKNGNNITWTYDDTLGELTPNITGIIDPANGGSFIGEASALATLNQNITGSSTYTWSIALNDSGYTKGWLHLQNIHPTFNAPTGCWVTFTTVATESAAISNGFNYGAYSYGTNSYVYNNSTNGFLTLTNCFGSDAPGASINNIRVDSVRINGSTLDIVFRNGSASLKNVQCAARATLFKALRDTTP